MSRKIKNVPAQISYAICIQLNMQFCKTSLSVSAIFGIVIM